MAAGIPDNENPAGADPEGYNAALEAIKSIHAAGGVPLSKDETVEFILEPINLGWAVRLKPKGVGRGPQSRDTQYDRAYARRKLIYHKLVRNPESSIKAAKKTQLMRDRIRDYADGLRKTISTSARATEVMDRLARHGYYPSRSTVQRVLGKRDKK
jgi:hypothetical protein